MCAMAEDLADDVVSREQLLLYSSSSSKSLGGSLTVGSSRLRPTTRGSITMSTLACVAGRRWRTAAARTTEELHPWAPPVVGSAGAHFTMGS